MNFLNSLKSIARSGQDFIVQHDSAILTGVGLTGGVLSLYLMHEATKKAERKIAIKEMEVGRELTLAEKFKETGKDYISTAAMALGSGICIFAGHRSEARHSAAVYAAYKISEETVEKLDKKLEEQGPKKAQRLRNEANEQALPPLPADGEIILTGNGNYLCLDRLSGRYFRSSINAIDAAITNANNQLKDEMYLTYNDLCDYLDIPLIPLGSELRWDINTEGFLTRQRWDYCGGERTGEPCLILDWEKYPHPIKRYSY